MRPRHVIYDELLRHQVDLSFDLERSFFRTSEAWNRATTVLDFGCGNAYYACRLSVLYPEKRFVCVEKDGPLAEIAKARASRHPIEVVHGTVDQVSERGFDFLLARHSVSYLPDRRSVMRTLADLASPTAGVLTIDADDAAMYAYPQLPLFEAGNDAFKDSVHEAGGNRGVLADLPGEWSELGFSHRVTRPLVVHSDMLNRKFLMYMFMKSIAEYDHGSPMPAAIRDELDAWASNETSYIQYGLFGMAFERSPA